MTGLTTSVVLTLIRMAKNRFVLLFIPHIFDLFGVMLLLSDFTMFAAAAFFLSFFRTVFFFLLLLLLLASVYARSQIKKENGKKYHKMMDYRKEFCAIMIDY